MEHSIRCPCGEDVPLPDGATPSATCPACGRELALPAAPTEGSPAAEEAAASCCPYCREPVQPDARKCPHCHEYLDRSLAPQPPPAPRASPFAIASFILAVLSPFSLCLSAPIAALLGIAGLLDRKATKGKRMAVAGILLGILWTLVLVLLILPLLRALVGGALDAPHAGSPAEPLF